MPSQKDGAKTSLKERRVFGTIGALVFLAMTPMFLDATLPVDSGQTRRAREVVLTGEVISAEHVQGGGRGCKKRWVVSYRWRDVQQQLRVDDCNLPAPGLSVGRQVDVGLIPGQPETAVIRMQGQGAARTGGPRGAYWPGILLCLGGAAWILWLVWRTPGKSRSSA